MIITDKIYIIHKEPQQKARITQHTGNVCTLIYSFPLTYSSNTKFCAFNVGRVLAQLAL